jgi:Flp pilus assembly pilin Flp
MPHPVPRIRLRRDARGQTLAEYSLLVGLIAIVVAVALPLLGTSVSGMIARFASAL